MHDSPVLAPGKQAGALENSNMLHESRQRHFGVLRELADRRGPRSQTLEYRAAGRVRERREHAVEDRRAGGSGLIVNHKV
jgi:hypothetical protein